MLREITVSRKEDGGYQRRWYQDDQLDLFLWFDGDDSIVRFQLAYDKHHLEKAVDWKRGRGFEHSLVDDGGEFGMHRSTPLLIEGGVFAKHRVLAEFQRHAADIDPRVAAFVLRALRRYPSRILSRGLKKKLVMMGTLAGAALIVWRWRK